MKRIICTLLLLFTLGVSFVIPVHTQGKEVKTTQAKSYALLKQFMDQYAKAGFSKVVKLGDPVKYRAALVSVKIVIDPKLGSLGLYDPNTKTMTLSKDPGKVSKDQALYLGQTIWHELTHRLEDINKDKDGDKLYNERNTEYMTNIVDAALPVLIQMEDKANKGATESKLIEYWSNFIKRMENAKKLEETIKYPPDLKLMEKWFGFKVNTSEIEKMYTEGKANLSSKSRLSIQKAFKAKATVAAITWSGTWSSDWGNLVLTQKDNTVTGTYTHDSGKIQGTISGNKLIGTWSESPTYAGPDDAGPFTWTLSADGKSFSGTWSYDGSSSGGSWTGKR